jgi:hypothetical protein
MIIGRRVTKSGVLGCLVRVRGVTIKGHMGGGPNLIITVVAITRSERESWRCR